MFRLTSKDERHLSNGTHKVGSIIIRPIDLVKAFGQPDEDDGYKVSGCYVFQNTETKEVFTVYDWKMTTLYDGAGPYHPREFWDLNRDVTLSVGGRTDPTHFIDKLKQHIEWVKVNGPFEQQVLDVETKPIIALPAPKV